MKKELNILMILVVIWCSGIILAPVLSGSLVSEVLFRLYSTVCHQFPSRSFHINGEPFAVCIRCTSIYIGFLTALILVRVSDRLRRRDFKALQLLLIASLPMAVDAVLAFFDLHSSTTLSRIATGSIFGAGTALLLHRTLTDIIHTHLIKKDKGYELETR